MYNEKSLCSSCTNNCASCKRTELAMEGHLTYIYLKNGSKLSYGCRLYKPVKITPSVPVNSMPSDFELLQQAMMNVKFV